MQFVINSNNENASETAQRESGYVKNTFLTVNSCGFTIDDKIGLNIQRPNGISDYKLIYLHKGSLRYQTENESGILHGGEILLFFPYERQIYLGEPNTLKMYFVQFSGYAAEELLSTAGLVRSGRYAPKEALDIIPVFGKIINELQQKKPGFNIFCVSQLTSLLAEISRRLTDESRPPQTKKHEKIIQIINYMKNTPQDMSTVNEYAETAGLSPCYFITLFKEYTGKSPLAYRTDIKIQNAITLLKTTQISVNELADFLGYNDAMYFSRLFKNHTGFSPSNFKKRIADKKEKK